MPTPRLLIPLLVLPLLTVAACEREKKDPFAVPGAQRMQVQYVTFIDGQDMVLRTRAGRALTQVEDPCGGPSGPTGMSYAWLHAEVVRAGHDRDLTCAMAERSYRAPTLPDRPLTAEERAERDARYALQNEKLRLLEQGNAEQVRFINALPADDQPTS